MKRLLKYIALSFVGLIALTIISFYILLSKSLPDLPKLNQPTSSLAISNVTVINPIDSTIVSHQTVLIENGRIISVDDTGSNTLAESVTNIDGNGKFLIPGFWDMHSHLRHQYEPYLSMPLFIANGVFNIRDMGTDVSNQQNNQWRRQILAGELMGPRVMGQVSAIIGRLRSKADADAIIADLDYKKNEFIKITNAPLRDPFFRLLEQARKKGITLASHKPRSVKALDAVNAGMKSMEHARYFLFESFPGAPEFRERYQAYYSGQDTGGAIYTTEARRAMIDKHDPAMFYELVNAMVENETWFCPTHITRRFDAYVDNDAFRNDLRLKYINKFEQFKWNLDAGGMIDRDPTELGRKTYMDFYKKGLELTGKAHQAGLAILTGTDANDSYCFPGFSIHDELEELVKAGLSPMDALVTATVNPAIYFEVLADYGSIETGKIADMILLDTNPLYDISNTSKINAVIFNGVLYSRSDLDKWLSFVEDNAASWSIALKVMWEG